MGAPSPPLQGSAQQTTLVGSVNQDFTPSDPTQFCPPPFTLEIGTSDHPPLEGRVTDGGPAPPMPLQFEATLIHEGGVWKVTEILVARFVLQR